MTETEARQVLRLLAAPYNVTVSAEIYKAWWNSVLEKASYQSALLVIERLVETAKFMPKPAQFSEILRAIERRDPAHRLALPASSGDVTPKDEAKKRIPELRKTLGWERSEQHDEQDERGVA